MRKTRQKSKFTLVELIVAMAVFSILLLLMLQFFSGAQRIWNGMEKRNEIYAGARIAMDLMTTQLQNLFYIPGVPFKLYTDLSETPDTSKIYFATRTGDQFPGDSSLKFMTFQCSSADENQLRVAVYCNDETTFNALFPPFNIPGSGISNYEDAVSKLVSSSCFSQDRIDKGTKAGSSTKYSTVLAENVTGFQIVPYKLENDEMKLETGATEIIYVPYMLELRLSVLSPEDFERWKTITDTTEKDNFRKQHEYTFTRSVFLGDRRAR